MFKKNRTIDFRESSLSLPFATNSFAKSEDSQWSGDSARNSLGLRRLVRACSRSVGTWGEPSLKKVETKRSQDALSNRDIYRLSELYLNGPSTIKSKEVVNNSKNRIVVLSCIPKGCSLNNALSQVCGGPLERLVFHDTQNPTLELHFIFPSDAQKFFWYGKKTGLLRVNGHKVKVEWATRANSDLNSQHLSISQGLLEEVNQSGSRRTLIFSQIIPNKILRNNKKLFYPEPVSHFSALDIGEIEKDFSDYGEVVCFGPVISRKLCFSVHYSDIRSAIMAKRDCETEGSQMNLKYHHWSIWFAKDVTDRPCIEI